MSQLFDPDALEQPTVLPVVRCGEQRKLDDWIGGSPYTRPTRPRCNRPPGHEGNHQTLRRDAKLRAEWS